MSSSLANLALGVGQTKKNASSVKAADIIEFAESPWGVGMELYTTTGYS